MTTSNTDPNFEALLEHLRQTRGFDFSGYKRSSLMRRVKKRMYELGISSYEVFLDHLEVQHHSDQRHCFLPRYPSLGLSAAGGDSADDGA
jgi:chemotaxis methyl-accepting protein methylase